MHGSMVGHLIIVPSELSNAKVLAEAELSKSQTPQLILFDKSLVRSCICLTWNFPKFLLSAKILTYVLIRQPSLARSEYQISAQQLNFIPQNQSQEK